MSRKSTIVMTVIVGSLLLVGTANAIQYSFYNITNNNPADAAIGEAQLFVDVTNPGGNQVLFTYTNTGPEASSICDVYVDDGSLLQLAQINNTPGLVEFSAPADPSDLPGGNNASPPFVASIGFSADSDPPVQPMGVNPGEELGILYDIQVGQTFADVIDEMNDATLRLGIHVQGFASGGSESYITPEPMTLALLIIGSIPMCLHRRSRG
ncbi:MAG: hypothetical protein ACYTF1_01670 [Planctomycetota bacterium]|jgi:hypothetical protein